MSQFLVTVTGLIYLWVSVNEFAKGNTGTAVMFFGYAAANVGVWMQVR